MREFAAILSLDEDIATRYAETNGLGDSAPGDLLEREFRQLEGSGLRLEEWALLDEDSWEQYLMYLVRWAVEHNDPGYTGMTPACYAEWESNGG